MKAVGLAWAICFPCGILFFVLTKQEVDKDRLKQMKARQNMRVSNTGEYESQRFRASPQQAQFPEVGSGSAQVFWGMEEKGMLAEVWEGHHLQHTA